MVSVLTKRRKKKLTMSEPSSNLEQVNRAEVKLLQKCRIILSQNQDPKNSLTSSLKNVFSHTDQKVLWTHYF